MSSELNFFSTDYDYDSDNEQTGGGDNSESIIDSKNIDIIKSYRKRNRELHKRIQELEEEVKNLKKQLG